MGLRMKKFGYSKEPIKKSTGRVIRQEKTPRSSATEKRKAKNGGRPFDRLAEEFKMRDSVEEQHEIREVWIESVKENR